MYTILSKSPSPARLIDALSEISTQMLNSVVLAEVARDAAPIIYLHGVDLAAGLSTRSCTN
jgi:hypothetical protein